MPNHLRPSRIVSRAFFTTTAAATLILSLSNALGAQSSQSSREARRIDLETRQRALRELEKLKNRRPTKSVNTRPMYEEVAESFKQLQLRNYNLSGIAVQQDAPLDYARITEDAGEIRKRASQLKGYLALPEPDKGQKQNKTGEILTPEGLRTAVISLDGLVNSFVWNPVFQRPGVIDMEQSVKAGRDLEGIIKLSGRIRESAEAMGKGNGKKQ